MDKQQYDHVRYLEKKEEIDKHNKAYNELHKEEQREYRRQWHIANRDRVNAQQKRYRKNHPEKAREYARRWQASHPEQVKEKRKQYNETHRDYFSERHLVESYGMTFDEYNQILERQGGVCAICGSDSPNHRMFKRFVVDHDHTTGKVRGLLCHQCNIMIAGSHDNPEILSKAIKYLGGVPSI